MRIKDVIQKITNTLNANSMATYDRDVDQSGCCWSTHGGEVTVEHVCQVMTECIPQNIIKDVDTIIDMGCGTGIVCAASAMLFHRKTIIGVDCSPTRLQHFNALMDELHLRNVHSVLSDWNSDNCDDDMWEFISSGGVTLIFCNNINYANDNTQENMESLISSRCNNGSIILSYSTAFAPRGDITKVIWKRVASLSLWSISPGLLPTRD
jgi:SAM-dependent methyltransferase